MNQFPRKKQLPRTDLKPGEVLCEHCTAKCCRYFSIVIDKPETIRDLDYYRWFLLHDRVSIFTEDDNWYLLVHTTCKELQPDHRCGVYTTRPTICREYTTDQCEYDNDYTFDRYFELPEQMADYMDALFSTPYTFRSRRPEGLPIIWSS